MGTLSVQAVDVAFVDEYICEGVAPILHPDSSGASVSPSVFVTTLMPGESIVEVKNVTTDPTPIGRLDVMFLFDLTGSMGDDISQIKASANSMIANISSSVSDVAFGVGSFMDYPTSYNYCGYSSTYGSASSDVPFKLDEDVTKNVTSVEDAINSLVMGSGYDGPESYARALKESINVSWRDGAKKVVVIFEDNVPHDCNLGDYGCSSSSTGTDPGSDGIAGTGDDIAWDVLAAELKAAGITVIVLEADFGVCDGVWEYMANMTGGIFSEVSSSEDITDEIIALIEETTSVVDVMSIVPQTGFESWVNVDPLSILNVSGDTTVTFMVNITVPNGTEPGEYNFYNLVVGDGSVMAVQDVNVTVPGTCGPECEPEYAMVCYDGDSYWEDSCGNKGELIEACVYGCNDGVCEEEKCKEEDSMICYNGNSYWEDSCGNKGELIETCEFGCMGAGVCKDEPVDPGEKVQELGSCQKIEEEGSYVLTQNLMSNRSCFEIETDDVLIDCNGFNLVGELKGYGFDIENRDNVTVMNCNVSYFGRGFNIKKIDESLFKNLNVFENKLDGIRIKSCDDTSFEQINSFNNGHDGFYIKKCKDSNFTDITANWNEDDGFYIKENINNSFINIESKNNAQDGFYFVKSLYNDLMDTLFEDNGDDDVFLKHNMFNIWS
ncbi:MAG: right-handed parallel beta-helix repeat-containing protein [Nanoarchaeota archaeon]|nr:right-handed parallel beta-helix repeat-containing protein [Nanoarchaeota archaeon]